MDIADATTKRSFKQGLIRRLHDPFQLRMAICVMLLAAWYWVGYAPMGDRITSTTLALQKDRKRLALATEVEELRVEVAQFADRLPPRSDPNEFLQYILDGIRVSPLKLVSLSPETPKDAGLYEVAAVKVELEGKYSDIDAFFRWVENNKRLLRIDNVKVDPDSKDPELLKVQLSVVGLMGVEDKPKAEVKPNAAEKPKAPSKPERPKAKTKENAPKGKDGAKSPLANLGP